VPESPSGSAPGSASFESLPARKPRHRWLRAMASWFATLAGAGMALQLVVLTIDIGPPSIAVGTVTVASAMLGVAGAVAFWRLVASQGGRPRLAGALLVVAITWASLSALMMAWLFAAFKA